MVEHEGNGSVPLSKSLEGQGLSWGLEETPVEQKGPEGNSLWD